MISIIIPLYNKESSVHRSLDSIISQSYQDWECIVVDDSSTDNSCEVVRSYNDARIKLFTKQNGGPSSARNYGVKKASGKWILFLDADDYFLPDALLTFADGIKIYPKAKVITSNFLVERNGDRGKYCMPLIEGMVFNSFLGLCLRSFIIRTGNTIFYKDIVLNYPFNEKYRRYEDIETFFSIIRNEPVYIIKQDTMVYDCNYSAASKSTLDKSIDYMYNIDFNIPSISFWEKVYLWNVISSEIPKECFDLHMLYPELNRHKTLSIALLFSRTIVKIKIFLFRLLGKRIMLY